MNPFSKKLQFEHLFFIKKGFAELVKKIGFQRVSAMSALFHLPQCDKC